MATLSNVKNIRNLTNRPIKKLDRTTLGSTPQPTMPNGYNKADYGRGWGIGFGAGNVSNNFNQWNDMGAVQNEINRMNTVMSNRDKFGMENTTEHKAYIDRLNQSMQPYNQSKQNITDAQGKYDTRLGQQQQQWQDILNKQKEGTQGWRDNYNNSQAAQDYRKIQDATIQDIGNKYGIDFSKDYANRQAEAEAQALRDANANSQRQNESQNKQNIQRIDDQLMTMAEQLDRKYFQEGLGMGQDQVESGLNAGIAADQALRLQMGRQADMSGAYRDANLGRMTEDQRFTNEGLRLTEALGTINQQSLANAERMYRDMLSQGYDMLSNDRDFYAQQDQQEWARSQAEIDRTAQQGSQDLEALQWMMGFDRQGLQDTIANEQFNQQFFQNMLQNSNENAKWREQFDYGKTRDQVADKQWQTQFDYGKSRDLIGDQQWQKQFDWGKLMDEAGLTGLYNGKNTWQRTQDQFNMDMTGKEFGLKEREFSWRQQQAALDRAAAQAAARGGGGGGSSRGRSSGGRSSGGSTAKSAPKSNTNYNAAYNQFNREKAIEMDLTAGRAKNIDQNSINAKLQAQQDLAKQAIQLTRPQPKPQHQFVVGPSNRDKKKKK
jgi:hypothetical protein